MNANQYGDLVDRLRAATHLPLFVHKEAADEIERLRAQVVSLEAQRNFATWIYNTALAAQEVLHVSKRL